MANCFGFLLYMSAKVTFLSLSLMATIVFKILRAIVMPSRWSAVSKGI